MDILEHLGMKVPDIEGHGVIISRATAALKFHIPKMRQNNYIRIVVEKK